MRLGMWALKVTHWRSEEFRRVGWLLVVGFPVSFLLLLLTFTFLSYLVELVPSGTLALKRSHCVDAVSPLTEPGDGLALVHIYIQEKHTHTHSATHLLTHIYLHAFDSIFFYHIYVSL